MTEKKFIPTERERGPLVELALAEGKRDSGYWANTGNAGIPFTNIDQDEVYDNFSGLIRVEYSESPGKGGIIPGREAALSNLGRERFPLANAVVIDSEVGPAYRHPFGEWVKGINVEYVRIDPKVHREIVDIGNSIEPVPSSPKLTIVDLEHNVRMVLRAKIENEAARRLRIELAQAG